VNAPVFLPVNLSPFGVRVIGGIFEVSMKRKDLAASAVSVAFIAKSGMLSTRQQLTLAQQALNAVGSSDPVVIAIVQFLEDVPNRPRDAGGELVDAVLAVLPASEQAADVPEWQLRADLQ
jgi:hypothetical protein